MNVRTFARQILQDPGYRQSVVTRANAGTLPPGVEEMLWELADGRVPVSVDARPVKPTLRVLHPRDEATPEVGDLALAGKTHD